MKKSLSLLAAAVVFSATPLLAASTWTGVISDSMCGVKHGSGEHGTKMSDKDCTTECVKGGSDYVFVSGDKIYKIENQDFGDLKAHAGEKVTLTGEMKDDTITVSKIEASKQ
ncbi:MAG TPA: hypothetical protein VFK20_12285 [Vicinamibacterales bacterium]|nr:hypothetical protein [Vicinamibacterales bacterium]